MWKNALLYIVCLLLVLISARVYFYSGVPYTHDGENHLARFANYKAALREGQVPPRFAPYLENGYGYPVFNYNYPLANILSVPLTVIGISYELTFKLLVASSLAIGGYYLWFWLGLFYKSKTARLAGLLSWLSSSFLISTILYRGSIGELLVYALIPSLLYTIATLVRGRAINILDYVLWIAFLLAHNVSALWITPTLLSYFCVEWWIQGKQLLVAKQMVKLFVTSVLATLWFWLPALAEMHAVVLSGAQNAMGFSDHYPTFHQLLVAPLQFGYSFPGSVDNLSFALGLVLSSTLLIYPIHFCVQALREADQFPANIQVFWAWFISMLLLFLQLSISETLWQLLPVMRFIQFPWRLSLLIPVLGSLILVDLISKLGNKWQKLALLVIAMYWLQISSTKPFELIHNSDDRYDAFSLNTTTQNENKPTSFTFSDIGTNQRSPFFYEGLGSIVVTEWKGSYRTYQIEVSESGSIIEPTMNFPGWETILDGEEMAYIDSEKIGGRIAYKVEKGFHEVTTTFTQKTMPRRIGNTVSLIAIVWIGISGHSYRKQKWVS